MLFCSFLELLGAIKLLISCRACSIDRCLRVIPDGIPRRIGETIRGIRIAQSAIRAYTVYTMFGINLERGIRLAIREQRSERIRSAGVYNKYVGRLADYKVAIVGNNPRCIMPDRRMDPGWIPSACAPRRASRLEEAWNRTGGVSTLGDIPPSEHTHRRTLTRSRAQGAQR